MVVYASSERADTRVESSRGCVYHRLNLSSNLSRDEATQRALKADGEMV